ncbi:TPA: NYN domain-containing protein [Candidatus Woesearchaeota archaeon]|nr:hypothetical protein QT06_C0001G0186 [archaeon GW2011_AR15]MBS3104012.1 NYN domain-containing protein [Candidatus Woesearchaeota archaeon]HIH40921.1 NYN domain-containing protein [Candidatus Woesearchaeota archaeon]
MATENKSMVFIDASNILGGWWTYCKQKGYTKTSGASKKEELMKKLDYAKLLKEITKDTHYIRGYFYDAIPNPIGDKKQGFFDMLRGLGVTIVTKDLRYKKNECKHCKKVDTNIPYQKGVDVSLATDIMGLAFEKAYDIAIIVSGDNDFEDAINYIKKKGVRVWVVSFISALGDETMRSADKVIRLDDMFDKIVL